MGTVDESITPSDQAVRRVKLALAILKSLNTPLDFPPSIHLLLICVDLV